MSYYLPDSPWLDKDQNPLDADEFVKLSRDREYARVARTEIDSCTVSTVWTGVNMSGPDRGPGIFETAVLDREYPGSGFDRMTWKSDTVEQALKTHRRACEMVRKIRVVGGPA